MQRTRIYRRHVGARAKQRVKRLVQCYDPSDPLVVGRLATTRRPCSCQYCHGHRRFWAGPPPQERRAQE